MLLTMIESLSKQVETLTKAIKEICITDNLEEAQQKKKYYKHNEQKGNKNPIG